MWERTASIPINPKPQESLGVQFGRARHAQAPEGRHNKEKRGASVG